jgi:hypothetical protein
MAFWRCSKEGILDGDLFYPDLESKVRYSRPNSVVETHFTLKRIHKEY